MRPFSFAWRSLTRQPARAVLGIAGIAVVGALLFDMLLLSRGLVVSFRDLLEGVGFDVRVTADQFVPSRGPMISDGTAVLNRLRALDEAEEVLALRFGRAWATDGERRVSMDLIGVDGNPRKTWTVIEGSRLPAYDPAAPPAILINRAVASRLGLSPGDTLPLRGDCDSRVTALPPVDFQVVGIIAFQFEARGGRSTVTTLPGYVKACDPPNREAMTLFMIASTVEAGPDSVVRAVEHVVPDLHAFTNQEFVDRLQVTDFSYFRQISFVLTTITLFFAFLLIATLLTVSVNRRLGEIAALRALGFRKKRIVADLLWESALLVGAGGLLGLPLGGLLALYLDEILRQMPGIPIGLHFFAWEPRAAITYVLLLALAGLLAAAYPVYLAARLPIAATMRREIV